jgi:DNA-binding NarL/FixJ family response regulator
MSLRIKLSDLSPVIIIDDDEFFQVGIDTVLRRRFGVETVVVCDTAKDAIAHFSGTKFGLALVDLNMPGVENRELLDMLKAVQPDVRLVVLSCSRFREDILMALSAGAQGFISKGLGIAETERALGQIADGGVYVPPFTPQSEMPAISLETKSEPTSASFSLLTPRQLEVLRLIIAGQPNRRIAEELDIKPTTVKFHLSIIFPILGASNRLEAALLGARILKERG